jgi:hypothetical protein
MLFFITLSDTNIVLVIVNRSADKWFKPQRDIALTGNMRSMHEETGH